MVEPAQVYFGNRFSGILSPTTRSANFRAAALERDFLSISALGSPSVPAIFAKSGSFTKAESDG